MAMPEAAETEWLAALCSAPVWIPPKTEILVVAPHPDDETLGAGGLIAYARSQGVEVKIAAVTDGEKAYPDTPGLAELRRGEQANAVNRLGVSSDRISRFGLPDGDVTSHEGDLTEQLSLLISQNTHVVAPWQGDFHPDHQACGRAAERVAKQRGAAISFYFFWTWHYGTVSLLERLPIRRFPLTTELMVAKSEALSCHRSQLVRDSGEPVLPELLLAPARRPFEIFSVA